MNVDPKTVKQWVEFVEQAKPMIQKLASIEKAAAEMAPGYVDTLIQGGFMPAQNRDNAIKMLTDNPIKYAESGQKVAAAVLQEQKTASAASAAPAPMGGAHQSSTAKVAATGTRSAADDAFLSKLGF